jgi:outer membrane lipoprotein SlyB
MNGGIMRFLCALLSVILCTTACATKRSGDVVTSSTTVGKVVYGTIMSSRAVTIKEHEKLSDNTLGGLSGGVAGGVAGSALGKGTGQGLSTIGGVIAGALLGAYIEDELGTQQGFEYIVHLDAPRKPKVVSPRKTGNYRIKENSVTVEEDIAASIIPSDRASEALSVIQQDEQPIANGTRVMVVIRDDGTRISPAPAQ